MGYTANSTSSPTISNNTIGGNYASGWYGGGIWWDGYSSPTITGNLLVANYDNNGVENVYSGGMYAVITSPITTNPARFPTANPTYFVSSPTVALSGTAGDAFGPITSVTWSNSRGGSGICTGTTSWSASLQLQTGSNAITVTATDSAGNYTYVSLPVQCDDAPPSVIYVNCQSASDGPGNDWDHAFQTVTEGLANAVSGGEVWVAEGTYAESIILPSGVGVYGGFAGTETARSQRDWNANTTVLDGNQAGTVVTAPSGATQATCIDGFTIRNGSGTYSSAYGYMGGGIECLSSSPTISNNTITGNNNGGGVYCFWSSSPAITNNTITGNSATCYGTGGGGIGCYNSSSPTISNNVIRGNNAGDGGGICCYVYSSPTITNNTITGNSASVCGTGEDGGGIYCNDYSSPTITHNTLMGNSGEDGGGICCYVYSSPAISNNTITGNSATDWGGGMYCYLHSSPTITNNSIMGNSAESGGGVCCVMASSAISNNTITGNSAESGGGIYCQGSAPAVSNDIVASNSSGIYADSSGKPTLGNNDVYANTAYNYSGLSAGTGDISTDPMFLAPWVGDYHLLPGSPCINVGNNSVVKAPPFLVNSSGVIIDLDGNPRIIGGTVDMGCYEWQGTPYWIRTMRPGAGGTAGLSYRA